MSVGPLGGLGASAAGSPYAQNQGSEVERAKQDVGAQARQLQQAEKAEKAAGVGETDGQDHETEDRDADGRRLWERAPQPTAEQDDAPDEPDSATPPDDPSGECGNLLDLSG